MLDIDIDTLPSLPIFQRSQLPPIPAIYFAIDSLGRVQYIGRSTNLQKRWIAHHRQHQLEGVNIAWMTVDSPALLPEIEAALIERFQPALNTTPYESWLKKQGFDAPYGLKSKLPELMKKRDLDQKTVAAETGLSPTTISKLYRNQIDRFDRRTLEELCNYFDCKTLDELIGLE